MENGLDVQFLAAYLQEWMADIVMAPQQTTSQFANQFEAVTIVGETANFRKDFSVEYSATEGKYGETSFTPDKWEKRQVYTQRYDLSRIFDRIDRNNVGNINLPARMLQKAQYAYLRKLDTIGIASVFADVVVYTNTPRTDGSGIVTRVESTPEIRALTGDNYLSTNGYAATSGGLTPSKFQVAVQQFNLNNISGQVLYALIHPALITGALRNDFFSNADQRTFWQTGLPFGQEVMSTSGLVDFMGVKCIPCVQLDPSAWANLPTTGTTIDGQDCAEIKSGGTTIDTDTDYPVIFCTEDLLKYATPSGCELMFKAGQDLGRHGDEVIVSDFWKGAVRMHEDKVIIAGCTANLVGRTEDA